MLDLADRLREDTHRQQSQRESWGCNKHVGRCYHHGKHAESCAVIDPWMPDWDGGCTCGLVTMLVLGEKRRDQKAEKALAEVGGGEA